MGPRASSPALVISHGPAGSGQRFTFYLQAELCSFVQNALTLYQRFILIKSFIYKIITEVSKTSINVILVVFL